MVTRISLFIVLISATVLSTLGATASPTVVGDPAKPDLLPSALQRAYQQVARSIVIMRGIYKLPDTGGPVFAMTRWRDAVITGKGVTLIMTGLKWGEDCFQLKHCHHLLLQDLTISQSAVPNYQGRVQSIGRDASGNLTAVWKADTGYPDLPASTSTFPGALNVVDAHTHELKVGDGDTYNAPVAHLSNGSWRIDFRNSAQLVSVGDWLVGRYGTPPIKLHLVNCRNCTIQNVTLLRNGFAPIREEGGGGNRYIHCTLRQGPMPAGADTPDLVTNAADGMHMTGSYPGPDIEDCYFTGVFLDDCIAIHGYFSQVKSVVGNMITTTKAAGDNAVVGGSIRISNANGFYEDAKVSAVKNNPDGTTTLTIKSSLPIPVGAKFSNPLADGAGYKIISCRLGDTRSRGILAKADDGTIENNVISHCGMSAISLGPEYYWDEADYVHSVLVQGNNIQYNGGATYGGAAVWVHGHGAVGNQHVLITNNRFFSNYQGDLVIEWAHYVAVTNNVVRAPHLWPATVHQVAPIRLDHCNNISFANDNLYNTTFWSLPLVHVGHDVKDITLP